MIRPKPPVSPLPDDREQVTIVDYLAVIWNRRRLICVVLISFVLIALVYSLLCPKTYSSKAVILVHEDRSRGGLESLPMGSSFIMSELLSTTSFTSNRELFLSVLKSRTMAEGLVKSFDLKLRYQSKFESNAVEELKKLTTVSASKDGTISVEVEDTSPQLAADMANAYTTRLNQMLTGLETSKAARKRAFIEKRLGIIRNELHEAEEALRNFQAEHRAFSLQEQAEGFVQETVELQGNLAAAKVELEGISLFASDSNPEFKSLKRRIDEIRRQLRDRYGGIALSDNATTLDESGEVMLPFSKFPDLGLRLVRLTRDLRIKETLFQFLTQQYEEAKISEVRDTPSVQVLDAAKPSDRKARPKTMLNLALATVSGLFFGAVLAFFFEYARIFRQRIVEKNLHEQRRDFSRAEEAETDQLSRKDAVLDTSD